VKEDLKIHGLRLSKPRLAVLEFFEKNKTGHFSINEIYEEIKKQNQKASYTSVYRTCKLLEKLGFLRQISFEERHIHYESNLVPHIHFQCLSCGKVIEEDLEHPEKILEILNIKDKNFQITSFRIHILGLCEECQNKAQKEEDL